MNKTVAFLAFAGIIIVGITGMTVLLIFRPEASATLTNLIVTVLSIASVGVGTFYGLGKVNEKADRIQTQTNGTLTRYERRNAQLIRTLQTHGIEIPDYVEDSSHR